MYTFSLRKSTSLVTLMTFVTSLCSPFLNIAHATSPDVALGYSSNPAGTGTLTITATYTDTVVGTPLITIDQPGWMDVFDAPMTDLGSGTIFTYDYTVNMDDGSGSVDGPATVSLTGAYNGSGEIANPASNATFTITTLPPPDTTPPVVTLSGGNMSIALSASYTEPGASWTDSVDGSGDTFTGTYGTPGSFAISGSVDTNTVGIYYIDYMKVDNAGNGSGTTRRVDVVSPANLRNATVAPPSNDKVYSNGIGQEVGRFGISAGIDPIRLENIDLENTGTSYLSTLASYSTGVELREVSGNTLLAVGTISGQTISFSGVNSVTPGYTTTDYKVVLQTGPVEPYYGQTLRLSTNSGMISIVKDADSSPLTVDDSMLSPMKLYTASVTPPTVVLTGNPSGLQTNNPIGKIRVTNVDSNTGMTISGVTLTVGMGGGVGSFIGSVCLRDIGSISVCGGAGTTTGQTITETGGFFTFDIRNSTLSDALTTLAPNTGYTEYEVYIDNAPIWFAGNIVSVATQTLEYQAGGYDFSQNYTGVGGASMIVSYGVGDTTPPVVTLSGSTIEYVEFGNDYIEPGASWTDNVDGSGDTFTGTYGNTGSFTVSGSVNTGALGTYTLEYLKVDDAGNGSGTTRNVVVQDTIAPVVTLSGSATGSITIGSNFIDDGATWTDLPNTNTGFLLATSGSVNTGSLGTYILEYKYTDTAGNSGSALRTIDVVAAPDTTPPVITLIGSGTMTVAHGSIYVDSGATALDNVDGDITASIMTGGTVDTSHTGTYIITYDVTDTASNPAVQVTRSVSVADMTGPSVIPVGGNFVTINQGTSYTESGATWTDNVDGSGFLATPYTGTVDINTPGTYILEYRYTDGGGNVGMGFRTVTVTDALTPVVTLSGSATVNIEYGNDYSEDGASWTDNVDGSGNVFTGSYGTPGSFALSGSVNTGSLGTYMLEYLKVDDAGNSSGATRTVVVEDTTAPVVTLSGAALVSILVGSGYTDVGASWTDLHDGAGVIPSYNSGFLDTNSTGSYTIAYEYTDISGNTGSVSRTVNVLSAPDTTPPVVTLSGSATVSVEYGNDYSEDGASWTDNVDGSGFIATATSGSVNTGALGTYILEYAYTDGAGNTGSTSRTVSVIDTTNPVITLSGSSTMSVEYGNAYIELGASWIDLHDGVGTIPNATSGTVNTGVLGNYTLEYSYTDISGNTGTVTRTVSVVDTTAPVVILSGAATVNVEYGNDYSEDGASWTDAYDGSGFIPVATTGSVNTGALGIYTLGYRYIDSSGNTGSVSRTVNVIDTTVPVVTLVGSGVVTLLSGSVFGDSGATWTDLHDGAGVIPSYNSGTLDVNTVGTYTIGYNYVDSSGNTGSTSRSVHVIPVPDTTPPVITLSGSATVNVEYGNDFIDDGAVWTDNVDGSGFIPGYTSGSVNTGALGTYIVSYEYTDSSSNVGTGTDRTIIVQDTTAPSVVAVGGSLITLVIGDTYTESGASWTDAYDGSGTVGVYSGSVDTNTVGTYMIEYRYTDSSSNVGIAFRTVNVLAAPDTTPPVITLSGSATVNVEFGSGFVDDGASWTDNVDGSGFISGYTSGSVNTGALGTYIVSYEYTDSSSNVGTGAVRTIHVVDTTSPTASVTYSTLSTTSGSVTATLTGASESITITNNAGSPNYVFSSNGSFTFTFQDGSGNTGSVVATVANIDTTAPVITLLGTSPTTVTQGTTYTDMGVVATDNVDGNITGMVARSGSVNTSLTGSYTLVYTVSDSVGNQATPVSRIVNVVVPAPVVIAPSTGGGGGGGGNIIGGVPLVPSANQATSTVSNNPNMQLGINALERLLRNTPEGVHTETQAPLSTTLTQDIIVSDIDNSDYQEAITAMIESGYVKNTKKFDPERPMTRNEFIKVLSLAYGFEEMSDMDEVMKFRDVGNSEFRKYIVFGIVMGWINPDMPSFRGDDSITYGEAIKLLDAAQGKTEANAPVINKDILSREHGVNMIYEEIVVQ